MEMETFQALTQKALQLAYFIHGDKAIATTIVSRALQKLEVAAQAQDKRLYYTPNGRAHGYATSRVARTRVTFSEPHLLQRLIYIESEPFEIGRERDALSPALACELSEEDMITHFIKHLVKLTLKRNSFYVALGISRLLHNYSTAETMEIYNLAVQDPERVRDDYYYRSRKARLLAEMKERFGSLLRSTRLHRGEERFEADPLSRQHEPLVRECLARFTPWMTPCVMPETFNPLTDIVRELCFDSRDPDAEHTVEINRIHALLHPDCYLRLVAALQYDAPASRLEIPRFFLAENAGRPPRNRRPANWSDDEITAIGKRLDEDARRRRGFSSGLLRIQVDGVEQARMDLRRTTRARFELAAGAELLEVIGEDRRGEVLLATRLLDERAWREPQAAIRLEGGQQVQLTLTPSFDSQNEIESASVEVAYRETNALRAAALVWRQRATRFGEAFGVSDTGRHFSPALALVLLALLAAGVWFLLPRGESPLTTPQQAEGAPPPVAMPDAPQLPHDESATSDATSPQQAQETPQPDAAPKSEERPRRPNRQNVPAPIVAQTPQQSPKRERNKALEPQPPEPNVSGEELTRGNRSGQRGVSLAEVKAIALDVQGERETGRQILASLRTAFAANRRFVLTERSQSDARLQVIVRQEAGAQVFVVRLISGSSVIFPDRREGSGRTYRGTPEEVATRIVQDLN